MGNPRAGGDSTAAAGAASAPKLSPDSALFRRRARGESLRDLAPRLRRDAHELVALLRDGGGRRAPAPGRAGGRSRANEARGEARRARCAVRRAAAALVALLGQGLEAIAQKTSVAELEEKLAVASSERAQTQVRLQEAELRLQAAREREETTAHTYRALAERTRQQLGFSRAAVSPCAGMTCLSAATARTRTAAWRSPRSCCRPHEQGSGATSISRSWVRSASVGVALATTAEPQGVSQAKPASSKS